MSEHDNADGQVVSVLLADGWHLVVPGSFVVSPLRFGADADLGRPGFRFEEADAGSPYQPTVLTGPLHSILAIREIRSAARKIGSPDRVRAAHNRHRTVNGALLRLRTDQ